MKGNGMILKLVVIIAITTIVYMAWQKRHRFVRQSPRGATRTKLQRSYPVQKAFLYEINKTEVMKLVAFAYAVSGLDQHHQFPHTEALRLDAATTGKVSSEFHAVFGKQPLGFEVGNARNQSAHYQQMCRTMGADARFLQLYLHHREFFTMMLNRLSSDADYYATRNSDIIPSDETLQLLWTENLERP